MKLIWQSKDGRVEKARTSELQPTGNFFVDTGFLSVQGIGSFPSELERLYQLQKLVSDHVPFNTVEEVKIELLKSIQHLDRIVQSQLLCNYQPLQEYFRFLEEAIANLVIVRVHESIYGMIGHHRRAQTTLGARLDTDRKLVATSVERLFETGRKTYIGSRDNDIHTILMTSDPKVQDRYVGRLKMFGAYVYHLVPQRH